MSQRLNLSMVAVLVLAAAAETSRAELIHEYLLSAPVAGPGGVKDTVGTADGETASTTGWSWDSNGWATTKQYDGGIWFTTTGQNASKGTFSFWVTPNTPTDWTAYLRTGTGVNIQAFNSGSKIGVYDLPGGAQIVGTPVLTNGSRYLLTLTYDETQNKSYVYVNGAGAGDSSYGAGSSLAANWLLAQKYGGALTAYGTYRDVSVWDAALSGIDAKALYNGSLGIPCLEYFFCAHSVA